MPEGKSEIPADIRATATVLAGEIQDDMSWRGCRDIVALALLAERQRDRWMPIETAPKNTAVLAVKGQNVGEACFIDYAHGPYGWYWAADRGEPMVGGPEFWQPLPAPPSSTEENLQHD